jgi:D-alanyl-D-alanine carboxypeptidase (penicillin-binding protein 5/6)
MKTKFLRATLAFAVILMLLPFQLVDATSVDSVNNGDSAAYNSRAVPNIKARSAILVDSLRGQVLYEKQPTQKLHISAACKIMTALVAIEDASLDSKVTISKDSVEAEGSALNLEVGEKYSVEDLVYGIMLTSANDAAKALAEYIGEDVQKFVALMNNKANELNMKDTKFVNPTGLYDESQYTTAYDIALLMRYAISNPDFNRIFSTRALPWISGSGDVKVLTNQNKLFWSYDGVDGGKTGFNSKEHQTAITTASKGDQRLISIVLDSPEESVFDDSEHLLDYGFNNYKVSVLVPKNSPQKTAQVDNREINLISINDVYYTHPVGENYIKSFECEISSELKLPIKKDQVVGTAKYILNDETVISINLYPDTEINPPEDFLSTAKKRLLENKDIFYLLVTLVIIEAFLILYNILRLMHKLVKKVFISEKK